MKGTIHFIEDLGYIVRYNSEDGEVAELPLHPIDVDMFKDYERVFDNLHARLADIPFQFDIVGVQKMSGVSKYAKLTPYDKSLNLMTYDNL